MVTLYIKEYCRHSIRVMATLDMYGVPFEKKDIADPTNEAELLELGGRRTVPFMTDGDVRMYESDDIVAYIEKTYGTLHEGVSAALPRIDADAHST